MHVFLRSHATWDIRQVPSINLLAWTSKVAKQLSRISFSLQRIEVQWRDMCYYPILISAFLDYSHFRSVLYFLIPALHLAVAFTLAFLSYQTRQFEFGFSFIMKIKVRFLEFIWSGACLQLQAWNVHRDGIRRCWQDIPASPLSSNTRYSLDRRWLFYNDWSREPCVFTSRHLYAGIYLLDWMIVFCDGLDGWGIISITAHSLGESPAIRYDFKAYGYGDGYGDGYMWSLSRRLSSWLSSLPPRVDFESFWS